MQAAESRESRLLEKIVQRRQAETQKEIEALTARADYLPEFKYFLNLLKSDPSPDAVSQRVAQPVAAIMCLQIPLEILHAFELHPFKIISGSFAATYVAAGNLPALICPMLKAALGAQKMVGISGAGQAVKAWVIPATCDWVVNFCSLMELGGCPISAPLHFMDLPHLKDAPRSQERWLQEVFAFRDFLVKITGVKLQRKKLANSVAVFKEARAALNALITAKRAGKISHLWFSSILNSFFLDKVERWTERVDAIIPCLKVEKRGGPNIMLAGSPAVFPNFKIFHLLEKWGFNVAADDLCTSERLLSPVPLSEDFTLFGLMRSLAESCHQGCLCPTFADNDRRFNNILEKHRRGLIEGVVFHVLKGCHPYELESYALEKAIKALGLKYLRIETDYTSEDSQNIDTRLEAFRATFNDW